MDKLSRYIQTHREDFEVDAPEGHGKRFLKKLNHRHRRSLLIRARPVLKIAGITLLFILSGLWILEHTNLLPSPEKDSQIAEFKETENYYAIQVSQKYNQLKHMKFVGDTLQKQIILKEFGSMDSVYYQLQKDLKMNPGDERILHAMIEYYQTKLNALNTIINQLSQIQNNNKPKSHEKTNL